MEDLHVFRNEATGWFVARDKDDAVILCKEWHVKNRTNCDEDEMGLEFTQCDDNSVLKIADDDDQSSFKTETCREWAKVNGRGFLCSQNY